MVFLRQRLLLALLKSLGGHLRATDFQKLLFLYTRDYEDEPSYDFVPYKFGSFSFTSYADKRKLIERGWLRDDEAAWTMTPHGEQAVLAWAESLANTDRFALRHQGLRGKELVAKVYRAYPYYAIRSTILEDVLSDPGEIAAVHRLQPEKRQAGLVTLGYEGKSLENYLNQLIQHGVTVLCDVRRNALSRKYGFSKRTLQHACAGVGIRYEHLPELGIESKRRKKLESQADYDALFRSYTRNDLPLQGEAIERIARWIEEDCERVALTCYELEHTQCHRHCVANFVQVKLDSAHHIQHLGSSCRENAF